jgi:hypothetical protein
MICPSPVNILCRAALIIAASLALAGCVNSTPPSPSPRSDASSAWVARLVPGLRGKFADYPFTIAAAAQVEVTRGGQKWVRSEFDLAGAPGPRALLLNGLNGDLDEWHLLLPPQLPPVFSPDEAGQKKPGDVVVANQITTHITDTWQSRTLAVMGDSVLLGAKNEMLRGFTTHGTNEWMLVRWHEFRMWIHIGEALPAAEVMRGFGLTSADR